MLAMCAKKLPRPPPERKREIDDRIKTSNIDDETAVRLLRRDLSWRDWVLRDFLRYWYGAGAFTLDAFLIVWIHQDYRVRDIIGITGLIILAFTLAILEVFLYRRIWPGGIFFKEQ